MLPTEELGPLSLGDGGQLDVAVSARTGIVITKRDFRGGQRGRVDLPHPGAGFGGGGTLLSPSERYVVVHYFSGQSEETFCLLDVADALELVAAPDYFFGEGASYAFSPDEELLLMVLPETVSEWWQRWEEDGLEMHEDGTAFLPFATLVTCVCKTGELVVSSLIVVPSVDEALHTGRYDPDLAPRFVSPRSVRLSMPWGDTTIDLPNRPSMIGIGYPPAPTP